MVHEGGKTADGDGGSSILESSQPSAVHRRFPAVTAILRVAMFNGKEEEEEEETLRLVIFDGMKDVRLSIDD
jgi:hypothetical protein